MGNSDFGGGFWETCLLHVSAFKNQTDNWGSFKLATYRESALKVLLAVPHPRIWSTRLVEAEQKDKV